MISASKIVAGLGARAFAPVLSGLLQLSGWKRKTVEANLRHVYGEEGMSSAKRGLFYRQLISNLSRHVSEILFSFGTYKELPHETESYPCRTGGSTFEIAAGSAPVLQEMRRGGIFLTAHYGNYEAMGPWLCRLGIPLKASYIPLKPAWLNSFVERRLRSVAGESYAVNPGTPREFLRILDEGNLFCLLSDQDSRIPSARESTLLQKRVHVNPLPDFLRRHLKHKPVYVCWIEEKGRCKILHAETLLDNDQKETASEFNRWLERRIAENPALWYGWTHRRFYSVAPEIYHTK